ncbi:hypothetical protein HMPREF0682_1158 [Propionibacterium acidifaciens F0233]|uniref:Uncharacterized protein n=1 Tax=Propionibacterium acidifaciens F0233 TaxID=553198 RepID=U2Q5I6_9ACTN|nr:hypothetical protein HMPREF0682_1158 [Propionibacterium acidifaciens F0233]
MHPWNPPDFSMEWRVRPLLLLLRSLRHMDCTEIRPHIRISCHGPANLFITPISSWRPDMISPGCDDTVHTVGPSGP